MIYAFPVTMMQRLLLLWSTRLTFAVLAMSLLLVHPALCSPTRSSLDQSGSRLGSVVDITATNRLARAISATPNNSSVAGYSYSGCYADTESTLLGSTRSLLGDRSYISATGMTWNACTTYCSGYQYAGITGGSTCKCGNSLAFSTIPVLDTLCSTPCTGNSLQSCGSSSRLTLFRSTNHVSTSSSPSAAVAINAVVALTAALSAPVPVVPLTSRPSTLSTVASLNSPPLAPLSTLIGHGLAAVLAPLPGEDIPTTLIGPALSFVELVSQVVAITSSPASTLKGLPLSVAAPTAQPPVPIAPLLSVLALSLPTSTQIPAPQPLITAIPLSPPVLAVPTGLASNPLTPTVLAVPSLVNLNAGPFALPSISGGAAPISTLLPLAALANIQFPPVSQPLAQPILSVPPPSAIVPAISISQIPVAPQSLAPIAQVLAPIAPVLISPALLSPSSAAAVATPAPNFVLAPSSSLVVGAPAGVETPSPAAFTPNALAFGALGFLGGPPFNPVAVVLPTTVSSVTVSPLAQSTRLPFSAAPVFQLPSSVGLPSIDVAPAGAINAFLASTNDGMMAAQLFGPQDNTMSTLNSLSALALLPEVSDNIAPQLLGPQSDPAMTLPIAIPPAVTPLFPASLLPVVPPLFPASPNSASPLPTLVLAQQLADLIPTVTTAPTALTPDNIPFDQQFALPSDGATPWWVITDFLEPHGLSTEPTIFAPPPLLLPEPIATESPGSLPTMTNLLASAFEPLPPSIDLGSPIPGELAPSSDAFFFDWEDSPWAFAVPYSPQAQAPILRASFKLDAEGNLPSKKDLTNRYAASTSSEPSDIETGKLIAKVWTYEFYDNGLVRVDDTYLNPWSWSTITGYLPDGTRIGMDSAGVYVGWEKRVQFGPEMLDVMKYFWLPPPQYFI